MNSFITLQNKRWNDIATADTVVDGLNIIKSQPAGDVWDISERIILKLKKKYS